MRRCLLTILPLLLSFSFSAYAARVYVPQDAPTIQSGVDLAEEGDTVVIARNTYTEDITVVGKSVLLASSYIFSLSSDDISSTVIVGAVELSGGEFDIRMGLLGLTLDGGIQTERCSLDVENSKLVSGDITLKTQSYLNAVGSLIDGLVTFDSSSNLGWISARRCQIGGVFLNSGTQFARLDSCRVSNEVAGYGGPSIQIDSSVVGLLRAGTGSHITASRCLITDGVNSQLMGEEESSYVSLSNCTILGPVLLPDGSSFDINRSIVYADTGCGLWGVPGGNIELTIDCSLMFGPNPSTLICGDSQFVSAASGQISITDPRFCDAENGDFSVAANSPCAPANNPCSTLIGCFPVGCGVIGRVHYVDVSGNDSIGNGTEEYPFRTIQHAIDISAESDTVIVEEGYYYERIDFLGKAIAVGSRFLLDGDTSHISLTAIDGDTSVVTLVNDTGSVVCFVNGEDSASQLVGFTVTGGFGTSFNWLDVPTRCGGGIFVVNSHPRVSDCTIESNYAENGGGIFVSEGAPEFNNCRIHSNEAATEGGGAFLSGLTGNLVSCQIYSNTAPRGGGFWIQGVDGLTLRSCTVNANVASEAAGLWLNHLATISVHNTKLLGPGSSIDGEGYSVLVDSGSVIVGASVDGDDYRDLRIENSLVDGATITGINNGFAFQNDSIVNSSVICHDLVAEHSMSGCVVLNSTVGLRHSDIALTDCLFQGSIQRQSMDGNIAAQTSTLDLASSLDVQSSFVSIDRCILVMDSVPVFVNAAEAMSLELNCSNFYSFPDNQWSDSLPPSATITDVSFLDPRFCGAEVRDYNLALNSPCAPANNPCSTLIGCYPVGCDPITRVHFVDTAGSDLTGDGSETNPFGTIQHAIEVSADFDTVIVSDGHYYERINFMGKAISVGSRFLLDADFSHINQTILDGDTTVTPPANDTGSVVCFVNEEDSLSRLVGLTIRGGTGTWSTRPDTAGYCGGGIYCDSTGPEIAYCQVIENRADYGAGLFYWRGASSAPVIMNSSCSDNRAASSGGGVWIGGGGNSVYLSDCLVGSNIAANGGAIFSNDGTDTYLQDCTVRGDGTIGIFLKYQAGLTAARCTLTSDSVLLYTEHANMVEITDSSLVSGDIYGYGFLHFYLIDSKIVEAKISGLDTYYMLQRDSVINCDIRTHDIWGFDVNNCIILKSWLDIGNTETVHIDSSLVQGVIEFRQSQKSTENMTGSSTTGAADETEVSKLRFTAEQSTFILDTSIALFNTTFSAVSCIFRTNDLPIFVSVPSFGFNELDLSCCDLYGFSDSTWLFGDSVTIDTSFLYFNDPLFCGPESGDFSIRSSSPCAAANNDCNVLIGAFDVSCQNEGPQLISADSVSATEDSPFVYIAQAEDPDGPDITFSFSTYPDWLSADADSLFGTPVFGDGDSSFEVLVSDGFASDSMSVMLTVVKITPELCRLSIDGQDTAMHVVDSMPTISWAICDEATSMDSVLVAVGDDSDWAYAEQWNPAPYHTDGTSIRYGGARLYHGVTYYLRLKVHNGLKWSPWYQEQFRMNSAPSSPLLVAPEDSSVVSLTPALSVRNSDDAENDTLSYIFDVYSDSACQNLIISSDGVSQGTDTITSWTPAEPLGGNQWHWWSCRAFDGYEYSEPSDTMTFRTGCCGYYRAGYTGNTDCSLPAEGDLYSEPTLSDITRLIDRVYVSHEPLCCEGNGNVDGSQDADPDLNDIMRLIDHVYISHKQTEPCP